MQLRSQKRKNVDDTNQCKNIDSTNPDEFVAAKPYAELVDSSDSISDSDYRSKKSESESMTRSNSHESDLSFVVPDEPVSFEDLLNKFSESVSEKKSEEAWKKGLTEEEISSYEPKLKKIRTEIQESAPTIPKILNSTLPDHDKRRAIRYYDIMSCTDPHSYDHISMEFSINQLLSTAPIVNQNTNSENTGIKTFDQEFYDSLMRDRAPTLSDIVNANLSKTSKAKAVELYESMWLNPYLTDGWLTCRDAIKTILESQSSNTEELQAIEKYEALAKEYNKQSNNNIQREIYNLQASDNTKIQIMRVYMDLLHTNDSEREARLRDKISWYLRLPHEKIVIKEDSKNVKDICLKAYQCLDNNLYGMKEIKSQIVQVMNDRLQNPSSRAILALKGKPGVGKTKLASVIAEAAGMPFEKISLGGTTDPVYFKGNESYYVGSMPSIILQLLAKVRQANVVILLDEIDKLALSTKGREVQSSLLHILDPGQSKNFQDACLPEISHDISRVWFILAMNDDTVLDPALHDRLNIIELPSYKKEEVVEIVQRHTLPDALKDKGMANDDLTISKEAIVALMEQIDFGESGGMRVIERAINDIVSKMNLQKTLLGIPDLPFSITLPHVTSFPYCITENDIRHLLKKSEKTTLSYYM